MKPVAPETPGGRKSPEKGRSSLRPVSGGHKNNQSLDTLKVLIADDNPFIVGLLVRYLERLGTATPIEACDGRHALDIVGSTAVDVVLCDLDMPSMDGFEFLRHLAEQRTPPAVVIFSGQDSSIVNSAVQLGRAHRLRMLGSLSKPFTLSSLKAVLQQAGVGAGAYTGLSFQPLTPDAIRHGLANDAVELAYQPKVTTRDRRMTGVEALLRWRDSDGELKSPAAVIPVAERHGLINQLSEMVILKAMAQHGAWLAEGHHFGMAINVSLLDLDRYDFPEFILDSARSVGAEPSSIV